jgi:chromosome segregation ATPase
MADIDLRWNDLLDIELRIQGNADAKLLFEALRQAKVDADRIEGLEEKINELENDLAGEKTENEELRAQVSDLERELKDRNAEIGRLEEELAEAQSAKADPFA